MFLEMKTLDPLLQHLLLPALSAVLQRNPKNSSVKKCALKCYFPMLKKSQRLSLLSLLAGCSCLEKC